MTTFELVQRTELPAAVVHATVPMKELPRFFAHALHETLEAIRAQGLTPMGPPFARYLGPPGETVELEAGFPVPRTIEREGEVLPSTLPGGRCAHALHVGPFDEIKRTYGELERWMTTQHVSPRGETIEVYLSDPEREPDPATWRTEILWPVD